MPLLDSHLIPSPVLFSGLFLATGLLIAKRLPKTICWGVLAHFYFICHLSLPLKEELGLRLAIAHLQRSKALSTCLHPGHTDLTGGGEKLFFAGEFLAMSCGSPWDF